MAIPRTGPKILSWTFGGGPEKVEVRIDTGRITNAKIKEINHELAIWRSQFSAYSVYPMNENESYEEWVERHGAVKLARFKDTRRAGESQDQHVVRVNSDELDGQEIGFLLVNEILPKTLGTAPITKEQWDAEVWGEVRIWLNDVVRETAIPVGCFRG